ncbi:DNA-binding GntR family transcriptional regulator [Roseibium marinum]|uniref:DNA-binding GntR family transcriptional regulator n=1 Tax=Roseibium marinum TaxID=281252 RepID=A0A2S3V1C9_9HYPH|nr:DNA-binding GntR family transcriptional regulator [Roseibium marinum]
MNLHPKNTSARTVRPVRRQQLHENVARQLRALILEGVLSDGDRIIETALCAQLNVSRTPLREAIKTLIHEGLIEHRPNRGARVTKTTAKEMRQLFEVISGLEMLAAETVATSIKPTEFKRLQSLHDKMAMHHAAGERDEYFVLNHQIHLKIVELSGNPILVETHASLMTRARHLRYQALAGQDRWMEAMEEHNGIMKAFEAGDAALAGRLMKQHVRRTGEVVEATFPGP